ncbi:MAG: S-layer homology domain-containing protein [Oscillospiraceae bacterium]|nr:S-layer homology domain-containing protein [Oscillospiraceae bacterium]
MSKRVLGLVLALVMVLTMLPFGAAAAEAKTYPATRIGLCEMLYDLFDGSVTEEVPLPFVDLDGLSEHQLDAVIWALANHITSAPGETHFVPNMYVTNGIIVTWIYRAAGQPEVSTPDVPPYYFYDRPERWCREHNLLEINGADESLYFDHAGIPDSLAFQKGEDIYHSKIIINMPMPHVTHIWDDGVVTRAPTCSSVGEMTYTCTICGKTRTEKLQVTSPEWDESTLDKSTPATGTAPGYAFYHCKICGQETILVRTPALGDDALAQDFTDVAADQFYTEPVDWAVRRGVTNGTDKGVFTPDGTCTRAQVVTFLWRAYGCPEPETDEIPFVDVEKDAYYTDAVLWANENGITNGTDKTHFSPERPCTRAHVVTFLWRAEHELQGAGFGTFEDVRSLNEYYYHAVYWAHNCGITNGTDATHFSPDAPCTRGQIVTFIYRTFSEPVTFIFYEG